jgi:carbon monoxide dehydrogenase subunit G
MKKTTPASTKAAPLLPAGHKYIIDEQGNIGRRIAGTANGNTRWVVLYVDGKYHAKVPLAKLRDFLVTEKAQAES